MKQISNIWGILFCRSRSRSRSEPPRRERSRSHDRAPKVVDSINVKYWYICVHDRKAVTPAPQCLIGDAITETGRNQSLISVWECLAWVCTPQRESWRRSSASLVVWRSVRLCWMVILVAAEDLPLSITRTLRILPRQEMRWMELS